MVDEITDLTGEPREEEAVRHDVSYVGDVQSKLH